MFNIVFNQRLILNTNNTLLLSMSAVTWTPRWLSFVAKRSTGKILGMTTYWDKISITTIFDLAEWQKKC